MRISSNSLVSMGSTLTCHRARPSKSNRPITASFLLARYVVFVLSARLLRLRSRVFASVPSALTSGGCVPIILSSPQNSGERIDFPGK